MRAHLRHQEDLVPTTLERPAQQVFGLAVVILPTVVEERDAGVHGFVDEPDRVVDAGQIAEVVTADSERRHLDAGTAERPSWDLAGAQLDALPAQSHGPQELAPTR